MKSVMTILIIAFLASDVATANGAWTTLDKPGAIQTEIYGIEGTYLVGSYTDLINEAQWRHGFVYDRSTDTWTSLDAPGSTLTSVHGIYGNTVVGSFRFSGTDYGFGYDISLSPSIWNVFSYPGSSGTFAYDFNGSEIIGYYTVGSPITGWYGFVLDCTLPGGYTTFGANPTIPARFDGDNIIGMSEYHGFIYDGATMSYFDMPGAIYTSFNGKDGGTVVGRWHADLMHMNHGFIYDGTSWTSMDFPGALRTVFSDIQGNEIVGCYQDVSGTWHGLIYTVPAPGTIVPVPGAIVLASFGLGLVGWLKKRIS